MDVNFTEILEEFMGSALVTWVHLFEGIVDEENGSFTQQYMDSQNAVRPYLKLTNGVYLNEVMRIIDPNPKLEQIYHNVGDDKILRVQNFSILNRHLRSYYQENLQQLLLMPLPNVAVLGRDPLTEGAVAELRRLLLLLLGCAVQCERKETFIQQIQCLDIDTQAEIALCIQEVTQDPSAVLPLEFGDMCGLNGAELQSLFCSMAKQIQSLHAQRDTHLERIAELYQERESSTSHITTSNGFGPPEGLAVQLADSKAKLRQLKQELEDKGDELLDYKQEVQTMEEEMKKLQKENRALQVEARVSRGIKDELDCLRERAGRVEQLQAELNNCTHRLRSMELYRTQLKEQQQYCASLQENKALLEEQLADARARCTVLRELEKENLLLRQKLMDMEGERDVERQSVDELLEMNMSLQVDLKRQAHSMAVTPSVTHQHFLQSELESDEEVQEINITQIDLKPLSEEVNEASSLRLLGAENENAELRRRLERLQAEQEAQHASSPKVIEDLQRRTDQLSQELQSTLREMECLKKENSRLKINLEELRTKQKQEDLEAERTVTEGKEEKREIIPRGECEGNDTKREKQDGKEERERDIIKAQREDGEGVEEDSIILSERKKKGINEMKTKERGEAEGEKEFDKKDITGETSQPLECNTEAQKTTQKEETEEDNFSLYTLTLHQQLQQALEEANRQSTLAQDLRSKLAEQSKKVLEAEHKMVFLEAENQRLKKAAKSLMEARKQIEELQGESMQQEEELMHLRSQVEFQKMEAAVNAQLEGERAALERERETLRATIDSLRAAVRKGDQLELINQNLKADLERLGRSLESAKRHEEELEAELRDSSLEAESLTRGREEALLEVTRLEQEKEVCQAELDSQRREQRQKEREMARLRQQLESTTSALEHGNQRACSLEAQNRQLGQELSLLKETCVQLEELQKENQQFSTLNAESKTQIDSLTKDLANERVQSQELINQVTQLKHTLEELQTKLEMAATQQHRSSPEVTSCPTDSHTQRTEDTVSNRQSLPLAGGPEESTVGFGDKVNHNQGSGPTDSLSTAEDSNNTGNKQPPTTPEPATGSQEALNQRLINTERENAVLQREREVLLSQLTQSQSVCTQLREQFDTQQRHSISLQENCAKLQALNTKLQVEQASLSSEHASVLARCNESEVRCAALEAESRVWLKEKEESVVRLEALMRDHERLTTLQQRQEAELEDLLIKHSQLKSSSRSLEAQYKDVETRYKGLLERKAQLEEAEESICVEREKMKRVIQGQVDSEKELERLRMDNERYQSLQKEWVQVQSELLAQSSVLRAEFSTAQLERTRLEGELSTLKEHNQQLDLNNVRLSSQYQLLTQLKANMEEENRHLVEQNQNLAKENKALLESSLESRDQHHNQQREYLDKLNELRREKQKLVEKIMDQYRVLEPVMPGMCPPKQPKKSNWIADRMKKLIKPKAGSKEGRAQFIAAGSIENLADAVDGVLTSSVPVPVHEKDPSSAPVSPNPLRRARSQPESEDQPKANLRSGRRKLGSRHGWALSRGRGGVSQSFSPGDQRIQPRIRLHSSQAGATILWEKDGSPTPSQDSLSEEGRVESEENISPEHSDVSRVSSGTEDFHSSFDKPQDSEHKQE
ncbi:coiled-coil domain containing 88A isoform X1 [Myxocyprinus asiaticus]|uniref:coiled-coil domain containing 88A isoform X1 n=1 Tax=Myxocyprinus asiaticus TaxID=70543 RepID=UPI0022221C02|nr:coiled-coil domain containing 88A isoform X1 [Myxocyprinus asiaticus]